MTLPHSAAADRNKGPILEQLSPRLAEGARVLEVGSGSGQHAEHFLAARPDLSWQPSELAAGLADLAARVDALGLPGLHPPVELDVSEPPWSLGALAAVDAVYTANTCHIMHWPQVVAMLRGVSALLVAGGLLLIYGPFRYGDAHTAPSNADFDASLRARDPGMGVRDLHALEQEAAVLGLELDEDLDLPANNRLLVFRR